MERASGPSISRIIMSLNGENPFTVSSSTQNISLDLSILHPLSSTPSPGYYHFSTGPVMASSKSLCHILASLKFAAHTTARVTL